MMGATVIRRKLNISSRKTSGLSGPLMPINTYPKINKLRIRIKTMYFFLLNAMFFYFTVHFGKRKVQMMVKKSPLKEFLLAGLNNPFMDNVAAMQIANSLIKVKKFKGISQSGYLK
jgi:hypothetical protein